jgi:hypothetical protein
VGAIKGGGEKDGQSLLLLPPEIIAAHQGFGRRQQRVDFGLSPEGGQPFRRRRQQVLEPDRVLADLSPGKVCRKIEGDGRFGFHLQGSSSRSLRLNMMVLG